MISEEKFLFNTTMVIRTFEWFLFFNIKYHLRVVWRISYNLWEMTIVVLFLMDTIDRTFLILSRFKKYLIIHLYCSHLVHHMAEGCYFRVFYQNVQGSVEMKRLLLQFTVSCTDLWIFHCFEHGWDIGYFVFTCVVQLTESSDLSFLRRIKYHAPLIQNFPTSENILGKVHYINMAQGHICAWNIFKAN